MSDQYFRVLSIDGGGVRGVIPAMVLAEIERLTGKPTWQLFDLIAGTSIGGLLALALTTPDPNAGEKKARYAATDLIDLFEERVKAIFTRRWKGPFFDERYSTDAVDRLLDEYFGETWLRDALTEVIITSYDIERRRTHIFKSRHARSDGPKRIEHDFLMTRVARATSAAPTYFEPVKIETEGPGGYLAMIDGGVYANNPALCAYVEAVKLLERAEQNKDIVLVSLGTGQLTHSLDFDKAKDWGMLNWAKHIIDIVFDGVSDNVDYLLRLLTEKSARHNSRYYRFQAQLDERTAPLDNAQPGNIRALKRIGENVVFANQQALEELIALL